MTLPLQVNGFQLVDTHGSLMFPSRICERAGWKSNDSLLQCKQCNPVCSWCESCPCRFLHTSYPGRTGYLILGARHCKMFKTHSQSEYEALVVVWACQYYGIFVNHALHLEVTFGTNHSYRLRDGVIEEEQASLVYVKTIRRAMAPTQSWASWVLCSSHHYHNAEWGNPTRG